MRILALKQVGRGTRRKGLVLRYEECTCGEAVGLLSGSCQCCLVGGGNWIAFQSRASFKRAMSDMQGSSTGREGDRRRGNIFRPHSRPVLTEIAAATMAYFAEASASGKPVAATLQAAIEATRLYKPHYSYALPLLSEENQENATVYEVTTERTCSAVLRICREGIQNPAALVFASSKKPGGGFLTGAAAQEESVCRCSGLFHCLKGNQMYKINASEKDKLCIYTSHMIYSPRVPVIRDSEKQTEILEDWVTSSFITAPAPNSGIARKRGARQEQIQSALTKRINMILSIAVLNNHRNLVLGAFGCGVFGNDPKIVSKIFLDALEGPFKGRFSKVVFAVLDYEDGENYTAYRSTFSHLLQPTVSNVETGTGVVEEEGS